MSNIGNDDAIKEVLQDSFSDFMFAVFKAHFAIGSLEKMSEKQEQQVIHRAYFYLKLEMMLFDHTSRLDDPWRFYTGIKAAYSYASSQLGVDAAVASTLNVEQLVFLLYPAVTEYRVLPEVKSTLMEKLSVLPGFDLDHHLPWNPVFEWAPGVVLTNYRKKMSSIPLAIDNIQ